MASDQAAGDDGGAPRATRQLRPCGADKGGPSARERSSGPTPSGGSDVGRTSHRARHRTPAPMLNTTLLSAVPFRVPARRRGRPLRTQRALCDGHCGQRLAQLRQGRAHADALGGREAGTAGGPADEVTALQEQEQALVLDRAGAGPAVGRGHLAAGEQRPLRGGANGDGVGAEGQHRARGPAAGGSEPVRSQGDPGLCRRGRAGLEGRRRRCRARRGGRARDAAGARRRGALERRTRDRSGRGGGPGVSSRSSLGAVVPRTSTAAVTSAPAPPSALAPSLSPRRRATRRAVLAGRTGDAGRSCSRSSKADRSSSSFMRSPETGAGRHGRGRPET